MYIAIFVGVLTDANITITSHDITVIVYAFTMVASVYKLIMLNVLNIIIVTHAA